jgi:hypothetical protein
MSSPGATGVWRRFLVALGRGLYVTWPVLSGILVIEVLLGLLIGAIEGWSVGDAVYFSFVTGLTIGYGPASGSNLSGLRRSKAATIPC